MTDLVVTVPMNVWPDWIDEGDAAGDPPTGEEWAFFVGCRPPPPAPDSRLYIVAFGLLRGWAPIVRVARAETGWAICRKGGAVACTLPEKIRGFQGWRNRWWERSAEQPFGDWKTAGVGRPELIRLSVLERMRGVNHAPG